jgi:hypothetical protein
LLISSGLCPKGDIASTATTPAYRKINIILSSSTSVALVNTSTHTQLDFQNQVKNQAQSKNAISVKNGTIAMRFNGRTSGPFSATLPTDAAHATSLGVTCRYHLIFLHLKFKCLFCNTYLSCSTAVMSLINVKLAVCTVSAYSATSMTYTIEFQAWNSGPESENNVFHHEVGALHTHGVHILIASSYFCREILL